ncbi:MAG: hypothetical protein COA66_13735 [Arcobacter sp.]|nr:MAG: hypothetical protein COA66_13735 [Arcobacter sp.]
MNKETKQKYRAKELAVYLGVGLSTIWRWTKQGKLKSYQLTTGITIFDLNEVISDLGLSTNTNIE